MRRHRLGRVAEGRRPVLARTGSREAPAGLRGAWPLTRTRWLTVPVIVLWVVALSSSAGAEPIEVNPSWREAPWQDKVQVVLDVTAQVALACCVLALLLGGAALGVGKVAGSYQAGNRGLQLILGGGGGALVVASAASIVGWLIS